MPFVCVVGSNCEEPFENSCGCSLRVGCFFVALYLFTIGICYAGVVFKNTTEEGKIDEPQIVKDWHKLNLTEGVTFLVFCVGICIADCIGKSGTLLLCALSLLIVSSQVAFFVITVMSFFDRVHAIDLIAKFIILLYCAIVVASYGCEQGDNPHPANPPPPVYEETIEQQQQQQQAQ